MAQLFVLLLAVLEASPCRREGRDLGCLSDYAFERPELGFPRMLGRGAIVAGRGAGHVADQRINVHAQRKIGAVEPNDLVAGAGQFEGHLSGVGCPFVEQVMGVFSLELVELLLCVVHPQPGGVYRR